MLNAVLLPLVLPLLLAQAAGPPVATEWRDLFDGTTLAGWEQRGGKAQYRAADGCLVGTSVPDTPNSFLCTEKLYGDFVLEYEFRVDGALNSGVQIRSFLKGERVTGYQVEIDMDAERERFWTAGIYEEGRRGWLDDLADDEAARQAHRLGEWNHVRVEAIGPHLRTWLNGVPAADLVDPVTLEGFIGLQVHGVGKRADPLEVRWRNLRIQDFGRHVWRPLVTGRVRSVETAGRLAEGSICVDFAPEESSFRIEWGDVVVAGNAQQGTAAAGGRERPWTIGEKQVRVRPGAATSRLVLTRRGARRVVHLDGVRLLDVATDETSVTAAGVNCSIADPGGAAAAVLVVAELVPE